MSTFPLNAWYACAYDVEVKKALLARTVCNPTATYVELRGKRFD